MAKDKLDDRTNAMRKELDRTPKAGSASTIAGLSGLDPKAQALKNKYLTRDKLADVKSRQWDVSQKAEDARSELRGHLAQPDYIPKWRKESNSIIAEKKGLLANSPTAEDRIYGENLDSSLLPGQKAEDRKESSEHYNKTIGASASDVTFYDKKAYDLRSMQEVLDIDLARKTQLADPRYVAEAARARVAEQFEQKRLLASFQKPSNPIMMVSGGSTIYRGGQSEEDQIDLLEEQTLRHLTRRKRLGMPLEE